jgi:transcriptional regulator with XRE-family HTH domain
VQTDKILVRIKEDYVRLIPPLSSSEYERLKRSIKEEGRLLLPVVLNQDNVVLDGHHRVRACQELNLPLASSSKDFTGRPLDEMMYVVNVNLYRRSLNDFQRAEVGIRVEELRRKLGQQQQEASRFTPETSQEAHRRRYHPDVDADLPSGSPDPDRNESGKDPTRGGVSEDMAERFGVSRATYDRVRYILSNGTEEMIESLRRGYLEDEDTKSKRGPIGIRTAYEELRYQKLQSELGSSSGDGSAHSIAEQEVAQIAHDHGKDLEEEKGRDDEGGEEVAEDAHEIVAGDDMPAKIHDEKETKKKEQKTTGVSFWGGRRGSEESVRLVNKDFRLVDQAEIQDGSIDLVLALSFPDPKIHEDEGGKIHEHLMGCAYPWLKEGGLLAMHVEQSLLPRVICSRPPGFQFFRMICVLQQEKMDHKTPGPIGIVTLFDTTEGLNRRESWRPYVVLVKGQRDTPPLVGPNMLEVVYTTGDVIDLATALVLTLCPLNGSICDPFMGKGVVGDATIRFGQGRKYIGIERDSALFLYASDVLGINRVK